VLRDLFRPWSGVHGRQPPEAVQPVRQVQVVCGSYTPPIRRWNSFPYWAFVFCQPKLNRLAWYGPSLASVE